MKTLIRALALSVLATAFAGTANATSVLTTTLSNGSLTYSSSGGLCSNNTLDQFTSTCSLSGGPSSHGWYGYGSVDYAFDLQNEPDWNQDYLWSLDYTLSYTYDGSNGSTSGNIDLGPYSQGSLADFTGISTLADALTAMANLDNPLYEPGVGAVYVHSGSNLNSGTVDFALDFPVNGSTPSGWGLGPLWNPLPGWDWSGIEDEATAKFSGELVLTAIPEPTGLSLLGMGLIALAVARRRKIKA